jgi:hypothetical protein
MKFNKFPPRRVSASGLYDLSKKILGRMIIFDRQTAIMK